MNTSAHAEQKHVEISERAGVTVLTLLDSRLNSDEQALAVRDELVNAVRGSQNKKFVIDMKAVEYVTSIALLPFLTLRKTVEEEGGRIAICNVADIVAKVLTVAQLLVETRAHARYLEMATDLDAAIKLVDDGAA